MASHLNSISEQPPTQRRHLLLLGVLFMGLSLLGLYAVYDQFAGKHLTFDRDLLSLRSILTLGALMCVYLAADGLRLYFTLRALRQTVPLRQIFRLVFINIFFSNITPLATGGGLAQVWYLQYYGVRIGTASAATAIRTVLAIVFISLLTPVFLLTHDALRGDPLLDKIGLALAILVTGYLGFFAVVLLRTRWLIGIISTIFRQIRRVHLISEERHRRWQYAARREMLHYAQSFRDYLRGRPSDVFLSILFTAVFLVSLFSFPALIVANLGYAVDYVASTGLMVIVTFIMYFSPTPGSSGISEGVFGTLFQGIVPADHLVLVILVWRTVTIYIGMLVGLVMTQVEVTQRGRSA